MRNLQHIAPDGPAGRRQFPFRRCITGKKDTARPAAHTDNGRVFVLFSSLLLNCRCFYNLYYTPFFAYFLVCLHFVYNFIQLSKLFHLLHNCYFFGGNFLFPRQIRRRRPQIRGEGDGINREPAGKSGGPSGMIKMAMAQDKKIHPISSQPPEKGHQDPFTRVISAGKTSRIHHDDFPFRSYDHGTVPLSHIQK